MTVRMLQRRGTASQWSGVGGSLVLQSGEVGINTTDNSFKIGDGSTTWNNLEYHYPDNMNEAKYSQLAGGNAITGNQGITGNVSITGTTSITGNTSVTGTLGATGATTLGGNTSINGELSLNNHKATNVLSPTSPTDAANKQYVDDAIAGLAWKEAANLFATSNIALTGNTNTLVIDGHSALTQSHGDGYRIVVTAQATATENGIYVYSDNGTTYTMTRAFDAESVEDLIGASIYINDGTTHMTSSWVQTNYHPTTFDTISWTQFSGAALINAGNGLDKNGNELLVKVTTGRTAIVNDAVDISASYVGQTSITTVSDTTGITTGVWNASTIALNKGGTGSTTASGARTNLGLGNSAVLDTGTTGTTVALGNHLHDDRYYTETEVNDLLATKVSSGSSPTLGIITANNYDISVSAEASNSIALNFSGGTGIHTRAMTGDVTFTASNYRVGATKTIFITSDGSIRNLTFPSTWIWVSPKPTTIAASKTGVLTVTSLGTAEANAVASWAVQA
jgi:hypothetical protein